MQTKLSGPPAKKKLTYQRLSDEEKDEIVQLRKQGWFFFEIAAYIGCSHTTVKTYARRVQLPEEVVKRLKKRKKSGVPASFNHKRAYQVYLRRKEYDMTVEDVAKMFGVKKSAIEWVIRQVKKREAANEA